MNLKSITLIVLTTAILFSYSMQCSAQVFCGIGPPLTGVISDTVQCVGNCVIQSATIFGSIECMAGSLSVTNTFVDGDIKLESGISSVMLDTVIASGVELKNAGLLSQFVITGAGNIGAVKCEGTPGSSDVSGTISELEFVDCGPIVGNNLFVSSKINIKGGSGSVEFCSTTVGEMGIEERTGDITLGCGATCGPVTIGEGFGAGKGTGDICMEGVTVNLGNFGIVEWNGDVTISASTLPGVNVEKTIGDLSITGSTINGGTGIVGQEGDILLQGLQANGMEIKETVGSVEIADSNFSPESIISINIASGSATVRNLTKPEIPGEGTEGTEPPEPPEPTVPGQTPEPTEPSEPTEPPEPTQPPEPPEPLEPCVNIDQVSGAVQILNNNVPGISANNNLGGVTINNNVLILLSCFNNSPAPVGSGNMVQMGEFQCTTGLP